MEVVLVAILLDQVGIGPLYVFPGETPQLMHGHRPQLFG